MNAPIPPESDEARLEIGKRDTFEAIISDYSEENLKLAMAWADRWHMRKLDDGTHNAVWACEVNAYLAGIGMGQEKSAGEIAGLKRDRDRFKKNLEDIIDGRIEIDQTTAVKAELSSMRARLVVAAGEIEKLRELLEAVRDAVREALEGAADGQPE